MEINIYVVETAATIVALFIAFIILKIKKEKGFLKICIPTIIVLFLILTVEFVLEKPQIDVSELKNIQVMSEDKITKPKVLYHMKDVSDQIQIESNIDYNKIGSYEITFKVPTINGIYEQKETINVVDKKSPKIILEGEEEFKQSYSKEYEEPGYKAIDEYEGDLTENVKIEKEEINSQKFNIKYKVKDSSNNESVKVRHVTIVDDIPPELTLNGSPNTNLLINQEYKEQGAKAIDEKDGDLTDKIEIEGNVDTSKEGSYQISYKVKDSSNNETVKVRHVTVFKEEIKAKTGVDGEPGVIYLTFDDGPSTTITPKILDILKQKGVKATFFILNYNAQGEELIKREIAEGHTVGIHGYSHDYNAIYQSVDSYMNNIKTLQDKIKASTRI